LGIIDFEAFRPVLDAGLSYSDGSRGGRPPRDPLTMFKVLILAAQNNVSDERMEFLIRARLSWRRFLEFGLGDRTPDENTIRLFRERLTRSGTIERLLEEFDRQIKASGYLAMGGQIVDASLIAVPRQRKTVTEKAQIKAGRKARDIWQDKPTKAAQKDTDAHWTVKIDRPRDPEAERSVPEVAIAVFGCKTHVAIDRSFGFIRNCAVTSAARHDGAVLREIVTCQNTASDVWAETKFSAATRPIARRSTRNGWPHGASPVVYTAKSRKAGRCLTISGAVTLQGHGSARRLSMSLPSRRTAWACSSVPSG
jgi:IS5 family transposase